MGYQPGGLKYNPQRYRMKEYKPYRPMRNQNYRVTKKGAPIQKRYLPSLREAYRDTRNR
jgi:hypothetical protein